MTATNRRRSESPRRRLQLLGAAAVVAAVVLGLYLGIRGRSGAGHTVTTSSRAGANGAARFHVTYPNDWKSVAVTQVAPQSGGLAALEQRAGLGLIIFRRTGSASHLDGAFVRNLDRELRRTTADYKPVGIKIINVSGEKALLFTYLRTKKNELHNIVVVPAGDHSFTIATASSAASPKIAKEVGEIIHSFKLL